MLSTLVVLVFLVGLFTVVAFVIKHVAIAAALVLIAFIFFAVRISVSE